MKNDNIQFAGIEEEYTRLETARTVLIPVPYDGTSTWVKGSDKGPAAFFHALENMELYDIETDTEVYKTGIHVTPPVLEKSSPEAMTDEVHRTVSTYLNQDKLVTLFGGEHSISIGALRAFREKYPDLTVLQIDAHADLRPEYHGSKCNHACAVYESAKKANLIQFGIRSMDVEEKQHMNRKQVYFAHEVWGSDQKAIQNKIVEQCTGPVYITIDLDAFDSSIMPSTGTPEPGGLDWTQVTGLLKAVCENRNVAGFDIVELCPNKHNKAPDFLAAKLYYKLLSYTLKNESF